MNLTPSTEVEEAPADGWRAADLTEDELVDDTFVAEDADSALVAEIDPDHELWPDEVDD